MVKYQQKKTIKIYFYLYHKQVCNANSHDGAVQLWLCYQNIREAAFPGAEGKQLALEIWYTKVYEYTNDIYRSRYTHLPICIYSWHQVTKHKDAVGVYNFFLKGIICIKNGF